VHKTKQKRHDPARLRAISERKTYPGLHRGSLQHSPQTP